VSESRDHVFATAIKILENPDLDYRSLVFSMAAVSPEALIKAVAESKVTRPALDISGLILMSPAESGRERAEIDNLANQGKKIEAIKRLRVVAKVGLKEAKDIVEGITPVRGVPMDIPMYKQNEEPLW